jgi:hypothetical protein
MIEVVMQDVPAARALGDHFFASRRCSFGNRASDFPKGGMAPFNASKPALEIRHAHRFPPPWTVEDPYAACFTVKDRSLLHAAN